MNGLKFVLDTNVVIGLLKGSADIAKLVSDPGIELENSAVSQITRIELLSFPRLSPEEEASIRALLDACNVLPLSLAIEADTIAIRRDSGLKLPDAIVAATARVNGLSLVTLDKSLQKAFLELGTSEKR